jgi:hypothetical protein
MKSFKEIFSWAREGQTRKIHLAVGSGWYLYSFEGRLLFAHGCDGSYGGMIFEAQNDNNHCCYCFSNPPVALLVAGKLLKWGNEYAD